MDIVMITTGNRPELLGQSVVSLYENAVHYDDHNFVLVQDSPTHSAQINKLIGRYTIIINSKQVGASRSRNIGASSIPKYRRQEHIMFVDDDIYAMPGWDELLERTLKATEDVKQARGVAVSGHAHPFNHHIGLYEFGGVRMNAANVLSTVHMAMPWYMWDVVGFFCEPGGPGGSEDVDWCRRASEKGYGLAVTEPQCIVHCGLRSSSGKQIVGFDLMMEQNKRLIEQYGLTGKVQYL